jgi:hypothetical protein
MLVSKSYRLRGKAKSCQNNGNADSSLCMPIATTILGHGMQALSATEHYSSGVNDQHYNGTTMIVRLGRLQFSLDRTDSTAAGI